jgi:hypothetical protein
MVRKLMFLNAEEIVFRYQHAANVPVGRLALLLRFREVPGSNIGSHTGYHEVSCFFLVPPGKFRNAVLIKATIHPPIQYFLRSLQTLERLKIAVALCKTVILLSVVYARETSSPDGRNIEDVLRRTF